MYENFSQVIAQDRAKKGNYPIDNLRSGPVDTLIIHHSAGDNFKDKPAVEPIDFISDMHKKRFYKNGALDSMHEHRLKKERVYTAYHFIMQPVKESWRITPTMWGVLDNVAGGTKSVIWNRRALQICVLGNYVHRFPKYDFYEVFTNFFKSFGAYVKNTYEKEVSVLGHGNVGSTLCPGTIKFFIPEIERCLS